MSSNNKKGQLNLNNIVQMFYQHQVLLKTLHFQTKSYGAHRATDRYLADFSLQFDKFMEVAQGIFGTITLKSLKITGKTLTDATAKKYLKDFAGVIRIIWHEAENYPDLMNILDEISAEANKLIYLLTFK